MILEYILTNKTYLIDLVSLFSLTLFSSVLGNLKTITMLKGNSFQKYILTFFDAMMFAFIMKNISKGEGLYFIMAYVLGRVIGMIITDKLENKVINTVYLSHLYLPLSNLQEIQEYLLMNNISFTKFEGEFLDKARYLLTIHLNEIQKINLLNKLKDLGIENPNIDFTELKKVSGNIQKRT